MQQRGLVSASVKATDISREYQSYCDIEREVKQFQGETLAYVTPVSLDFSDTETKP